MKPTGNIIAREAPETGCQLCAADGCMEPADYRAPRSRNALSEYIWFCLEHIRAYNSAWDYYAGMSEDEIEAHRRADVTWRRPTWPLGARGADGQGRTQDPFGVLGGGDPEIAPGDRLIAVDPAERSALSTLGLQSPASAAAVKARYKELVKELHPDANGGDSNAEERLKLVNQAYNTLRSSRVL